MTRKPLTPSDPTGDLFNRIAEPSAPMPGLDWPDGARFPLNIDSAKVSDRVLDDLMSSDQPLIVTGFSALDRIIDFVARWQGQGQFRLLLGSEPFPGQRESYQMRGRRFPAEVADYWLKRGISLRLSAKLIVCIEALRSGRVLARYHRHSDRRMHAKIYLGDQAATIGSSNFTGAGLGFNAEANARFNRQREAKRYHELARIAENYWSLGMDYKEELIELLEQLLQVTPWSEALAHACTQLLEGEWARRYLNEDYLTDAGRLWPAQRQGIAQALYILSTQGSVLVADATGSGKTRLGVHLVRAIHDQIIRSGRLRRGKALMVCPPAVADNWERESHPANLALDVYSHGALSHSGSSKHELTLEALRRAQILCVDEGHNFLNLNSNRSRLLLRNMADHVLLFTATPINRGVTDLLRIADMLGADNLAPSTLKSFKKMLGAHHHKRTLSEEETAVLRKEIQRFTVRRTKAQFNALIDRSPEQHRDDQGRACRFPEHKARTYALHETPMDRQLAAQIKTLAGQLHAVSHFVKAIEMPEALISRGFKPKAYLNSRLKSANSIAAYIVMASLRSSRAALTEHICGTAAAIQAHKLDGFHKSPTGNMLQRLVDLEGRLPANKLDIELPDWLCDEQLHRAACRHDHALYQQIQDRLERMSDAREQAKVDRLLKLAKRCRQLLAFDSRPITLAVIGRALKQQTPGHRILTATGDRSSDRDQLLRLFDPRAPGEAAIGLCSDSLSEGVNLQQAAALVHLDMPSVVRIAEQRIGRIDRMDSTHQQIEAWWPDDAAEFALSSDERFIERYEAVDSLLGSNMPLPASMRDPTRQRPVRAREMIQQFEQESQSEAWDGINDAFHSVRSLVDADSSLIDPALYQRCRQQTQKVLSRVSLVQSKRPWAFFCLRAGAFDAPHWVLLPGLVATPMTELDAVCKILRSNLAGSVANVALDEAGVSYLDQFLERLKSVEKSLMPRKKQRALVEMQRVLEHFVQEASQRQDQGPLDAYEQILETLIRPRPEHQPDWNELAARWLDVIRPCWYRKLAQPRSRPLLLKDIRDDLFAAEAELGPRILAEFQSFPMLAPPDQRIAACIVGVGGL